MFWMNSFILPVDSFTLGMNGSVADVNEPVAEMNSFNGETPFSCWGAGETPNCKGFDTNFTNWREFKLKALKGRKIIAQGWIVVPKSDEGGSETTLGKCSQNIPSPHWGEGGRRPDEVSSHKPRNLEVSAIGLGCMGMSFGYGHRG